jgi:hypothetical protein
VALGQNGEALHQAQTGPNKALLAKPTTAFSEVEVARGGRVSTNIIWREMSKMELPNIEEATLQLVPERLVRAFCVLPQRTDGDSITLYCPDDPRFLIEHQETLRFALNRAIDWTPIPRSLLETEIDKYFPGSKPEIWNCNVRFRFNCPRKWALLTLTKDPNKRHCSECDSLVHRCSNEHDARWLGKQGKCVALITQDGTEFLGEVDDT